MSSETPSFTYSSYLQIDALLGLQKRASHGPEHDEMLFIIIHQVYELWFKQMLHEGDALMVTLGQKDGPRAMNTLRRMCTILKTMVAQVDVLETMTPLQFASFRDYLQAASGFQSQQFRQLEILLGMRNPKVLGPYPEGTAARAELERRLASPSLYDAFLRYLAQSGCVLPATALERDYGNPVEPSPEVQAELIQVYRTRPELAGICERLVDLDEGLQEWRYRHVQMVQRTIGAKIGTGGSSGAAYLRSTLFRPFFPDLWEIRSSF